ncbi:nucleotidyltransferase family protein [Lysinibacillus cavernae]|uniref:nucleotidyltransferase family protein n=1 Tax=Lysinibacillus cavernae TaxID=2666135 RepID=UPI0012D8578A|nr:nucleotidyltransferase family protein [Lysinibacillus cavernae]
MRVLRTEEELKNLLASDDWLMNVLATVEALHLADWWICAGVIRSMVWDYLYEKEDRTPIADIDVIYFDKANLAEEIEKHYERELRKISPNEPWSVKNQARMHVLNESKPYQSALDGIAHFPEIPTAIGVKLTSGSLEIAAPYGIKHLGAGIVEPTPFFLENKHNYAIYRQRIHHKQWHLSWPRLEINLQ